METGLKHHETESLEEVMIISARLSIRPNSDLVLNGKYHFDPETDADWLCLAQKRLKWHKNEGSSFKKYRNFADKFSLIHKCFQKLPLDVRRSLSKCC